VSTPATERVPLSTKLAFGSGAVAYGIKDNGFSVFLLVFYNQVLGLDAREVGVILLIALVIDGFVDPAVGVLSDRTRTRIGQRHPWLYASAIPIALSWLLLWNPPEVPRPMLLAYLLAVAVMVRAAVSTNEVPATALVPEMTRDYHERTLVVRYRFLFGWASGLLMLILAYGVLLAPNAGGQAAFDREGFSAFATVGAAAMFVSVLVSAIGTHKRYARMPAHRLERRNFLGELRGIGQALFNWPFLTLMGVGLFAYVNQGLIFALTNYLLPFVWGFGRIQLLIYSVCLFLGVVGAFVTVAPVARRIGKKGAAALFGVSAAIVGTTPYLLRLGGVFPTVGDPLLIPVFLVFVTLATSLGVCVMMLISSMVADVVEASEERTGRREEGLFYAGFFFVQKCTTGIGIFLAGEIVSRSGFPAQAQIGAVPVAVLDRLTLTYALLTLVFAALGATCAALFPIGRADHEARLAKLAVAASGEGAASRG
jgi:glycoside/pentoside/hexuronide:cation symporter, GPH family